MPVPTTMSLTLRYVFKTVIRKKLKIKPKKICRLRHSQLKVKLYIFDLPTLRLPSILQLVCPTTKSRKFICLLSSETWQGYKKWHSKRIPFREVDNRFFVVKLTTLFGPKSTPAKLSIKNCREMKQKTCRPLKSIRAGIELHGGHWVHRWLTLRVWSFFQPSWTFDWAYLNWILSETNYTEKVG